MRSTGATWRTIWRTAPTQAPTGRAAERARPRGALSPAVQGASAAQGAQEAPVPAARSAQRNYATAVAARVRLVAARVEVVNSLRGRARVRTPTPTGQGVGRRGAGRGFRATGAGLTLQAWLPERLSPIPRAAYHLAPRSAPLSGPPALRTSPRAPTLGRHAPIPALVICPLQ